MPSPDLALPSPVDFLQPRFLQSITATAVLLCSSGCATNGERPPTETADVPPAFLDVTQAVPLTTRDAFVREVGGRALFLVAADVDAELQFEADGTLVGSLFRAGEPEQPVRLTWEWVDDTYCREGTAGEQIVERACEGVTLHPGVGVRLDYRDVDRDDEYWSFTPVRGVAS